MEWMEFWPTPLYNISLHHWGFRSSAEVWLGHRKTLILLLVIYSVVDLLMWLGLLSCCLTQFQTSFSCQTDGLTFDSIILWVYRIPNGQRSDCNILRPHNWSSMECRKVKLKGLLNLPRMMSSNSHHEALCIFAFFLSICNDTTQYVIDCSSEVVFALTWDEKTFKNALECRKKLNWKRMFKIFGTFFWIKKKQNYEIKLSI